MKYSLLLFWLLPAVTFAQASTGSLQGLLVGIGGFLNAVVIPFILAIAFIVFVINVIRFFVIGGASDEGQKNAKNLAVYGIGAFVFILSFWGIVNLLIDGVGVGPDGSPCLNDKTSDYIIRSGEPCTTTISYPHATSTPVDPVDPVDPIDPVDPVVQAPTCSLTASSLSITEGESLTLSWTTSNGQTAAISPLIGGINPMINGSQSVSPIARTTYTLTVTNSAGSVSCEQEVNVMASFVVSYPPGGVDGIATASIIQSIQDAENSIRPWAKRFVDDYATEYLSTAASGVSNAIFADLHLPNHTPGLTLIDRLKAAHRLYRLGQITEDRYLVYKSAITNGYTQSGDYGALSVISQISSPITSPPPAVITNLSNQARAEWHTALITYEQIRLASAGTLPPLSINGSDYGPDAATAYLFDSSIPPATRLQVIRSFIENPHNIISPNDGNSFYNDFTISENAQLLYHRQPLSTLIPLIP